MSRRVTSLLVTGGLALGGLSAGSLAAGPAAASGAMSRAAAETSPLVLRSARTVTATAYDGQVYLEGGVALQAVGGNVELWSHRPSWGSRIRTELRARGTSRMLPVGTQSSFSGLPDFLAVAIRDKHGTKVWSHTSDVCLNGDSVRVVPEGAAHSTYPYGCPANRFTKGSVQGIADGWATTVPAFGDQSVRLRPGRYAMTVRIPYAWRRLLGVSAADGVKTVTLRVVEDSGSELVRAPGAGSTDRRQHLAAGDDVARAPRGSAPRGRRLAAAPEDGPRPNLESLPAWGIGVSGHGNYLHFSATVWNGGDSPLLVDGFRRGNQDVMDAYQYFYDAAGNQTGYVPAGEMEWDARATHQHWHFRDFARYRLLDADKKGVARSQKEAFCLANTDAIDYTVPGANWRPDNTDLATACGDHSSLSVREVLESGSGDTYEQFRAGQSFDLRRLPNGTYYVSVEANPAHRLTETTTADNVALRKVRIGGAAGHRTVKVFPIGRIH